jgi:ribosomal protein L40E
MLPLDCLFCAHKNPPGAKFCNECGSPLHLAPCKQCDAINSLNETHCYQCGAALVPLDAPAQPAQSELELTGAARPSSESRPEPEASEPALHEPEGPRVRDAALPRARALDARRSWWDGFMAAAATAVVVLAIAGGGVFYYLHEGSRAGEPPAPAPSEPPRAQAPKAPSAAGQSGGVPAQIPARAVASLPPPADGREADQAVRPSAATAEPVCPPAVAAMALCEWVARANTQ